MSIDQYSSFAIPKILQIVEGQGGLPLIQITNKLAQADIYIHGAHVVRYDPKGGKPMIWTSPASPFADGKSIRGGIPVCFPWFGPHKTVKEFPVHGFLRFRSAELLETAQLSDGRTRVVFGFKDDEGTRKYWPHAFSAKVEVTVGASLELSLSVTNAGCEPFSYEDCFHAYFAVGDVAKAVVPSFDGVGYIDRGRGDIRAVQKGDLKFRGETVNVYTLTPAAATIVDSPNRRRIELEQTGLANTVVWNPGEEAAAKNPEMAGMHAQFLCVEAANCLDTRVTLLPGTSHVSSVRYRSEKK